MGTIDWLFVSGVQIFDQLTTRPVRFSYWKKIRKSITNSLGKISSTICRVPRSQGMKGINFT